MMNAREKGKRGERQWRDELRSKGYAARRGQQFCGSPESPDVVCDGLPWAHFEVKAVERLNIEDAMEQARRDARGKVPVVAHKRSFCKWLVTMEADAFFRLIRGDFTTEAPRHRGANGTNGTNGADVSRGRGEFEI
ncbi:MAG TPA: hypothetical protein PK202_14265 [Verrucomicrobiota bacterium]|nr:hypothetical protein [Verrucomicrobiota bacterium]HOC52065.1 hypothetical protein [Verrucomicrobiota bacterium]HOX64110.1 hypothetical protein [Verrucomicrobiota bacterium]HPI66455.1 hypothetical protein [Verrucomicrobiota bacterium]HPO44115.1 hypothetical protein [Verrucomicrobiota bacterium]